MFVSTCRRCGEAALMPSPDSWTVECAGEFLRLCGPCHEELRAWLANETDVLEPVRATKETAGASR